MIALYIIGGILLLLFLLCLLPVGIRIKYDKEFFMYIAVGFVKIQKVPAKKKKIRVSDYSKRKLEKEERKRKRKLAKKEKKKEKKSGKKAEKKDSVLVSKLKDKETRFATVEYLYDMLTLVADKFAKRLTVKVFTLDAVIGSDNAAKTAVIYGSACSAAGCISAFLDQHMKLKKKNKRSINIAPDFLSEKTAVSADVSMSIRIGGIFTFLFEIRSVIKEILKLLQEDNSNG